MCRVLHLSESGYYRWLRNRGRHSSRQLLAGKVKKILEEHPDNRNYGVNRVCLALEQDGVDVSRRTVYRVMKENGWLHKRCIPHGITKTTTEAQEQENILKRDFSAQRPSEKFLTDITEVQCADGKLYVSPIMACFNGASEMVTNLSMAVTTFLFNAIMMAYLGEAGVSAITIVLYAQFLLVALYMGFSMGVAPVFSFNRGAGRYDRMRRIFGYCLRFILVSSVAILAVALALSGVVVGIFSTPGSPVYAIALDGFRRFAPAFLFAGVNIFSSALFTALSDGRTSAIISFARTFGFLLLGLLLLPRLLEVDGVWLAVPLAELLSCLLSVWFLRRKRAAFGFGGGDLPRHGGRGGGRI